MEEIKTKTYFETLIENDPHFADIVKDFAAKIKANINLINTPIVITSNKYQLPYDNTFETHNTKIYFLRIMIRESKSTKDFITGIVNYMCNSLPREEAEVVCGSDKVFVPIIDTDDRTIVLEFKD